MSTFYFAFNTKRVQPLVYENELLLTGQLCYSEYNFHDVNKNLRQQSKRKQPVDCYSPFCCFCFSKMSLQSLKAATEGDPWKKLFLKFSQNLQENTCAWVLQLY